MTGKITSLILPLYDVTYGIRLTSDLYLHGVRNHLRK